MYLNIFLLVILLLGLIFINDKIKNKGIVYFMLIILIFLCVKKYLVGQKEYFQSAENIHQQLQDSVSDSNETTALRNRINELENTVQDLRQTMIDKTNPMIRDNQSKNFTMEESQKKQDVDLESLEKELDILLRLYRKENETNEEVKYKSLPVFSSCRVNDLGEMYKRDLNSDKTNEIIQALEKEELGKNLGIDSDSSRELLSSINRQVNGNSGNVDINLNLE